MAKFQLVMRSGSASGTVFPLTEQEITFGRDAENTIPLPDAGVSRRHARLTLQGNAYVLEDLGSTNGTLVEGQPLTAPRRLRSREVFFLGDLDSFAFEVTA
jgi:pSer/pThr/pTyr-binding forkhead associated (FHA) protein